MKALLLIIPIMFFITSCEDVDDVSSKSTFTKFSSVEDLLFAYSEPSENKYLIITDTDNISRQLNVYTYEESSGGIRNEDFPVFTCDSEDCRTTEINSRYRKIRILDESTRVVISRHQVRNDGDDLTTSSSTYHLVED